MSMLLYAPVLFVLVVLEMIFTAVVSLGVVIYFSSLPDVDLDYWFLSHRGFTHTVSFSVLIGFLFSGVGTLLVNISVSSGFVEPVNMVTTGVPVGGFFLGVFIVCSHIVGDVITPSGVRPFAKPPLVPNLPIFWNKRYSFGWVLASNTIANGGLLFISVIVCTVAFMSGLAL